MKCEKLYQLKDNHRHILLQLSVAEAVVIAGSNSEKEALEVEMDAEEKPDRSLHTTAYILYILTNKLLWRFI